jgi:hypothetical protein
VVSGPVKLVEVFLVEDVQRLRLETAELLVGVVPLELGDMPEVRHRM